MQVDCQEQDNYDIFFFNFFKYISSLLEVYNFVNKNSEILKLFLDNNKKFITKVKKSSL